MKIFLIAILLFSIIYSGCSDSSLNEPGPENKWYVKGNVVFGLKDSVSFEEILDTLFSFGKIHQVIFSTTKFSSEYPEELWKYRFVDTANTTIKFDTLNEIWNINLWVRGFNEDDAADWHNMHNQLNLQPTLTYLAYGQLYVDIGSEEYWIRKLLETDLFRWVGYNYLFEHH
jgi:hypothetical protein